MEWRILVNRFGRVLIYAEYFGEYVTQYGALRFVAYAPSIEIAINLCVGAPTRIVAQGGSRYV